MKKYEYVTKSKVNNYIITPKHLNSIPTKIYKSPIIENKPTMSAKDIIAANQNSEPISLKAMTDKDGVNEAYKRDTKLNINGDTLYIGGTSDLQDA